MYSGVCIGGPEHGKLITSERSWISFRVIPQMSFADVIDGPEEPRNIRHFTYLHSEEYTEWGAVAVVFIWDVAGAWPHAQREKFIQTALTGDGKVRKMTKKNQKIIWPECPDDWWERKE